VPQTFCLYPTPWTARNPAGFVLSDHGQGGLNLWEDVLALGLAEFWWPASTSFASNVRKSFIRERAVPRFGIISGRFVVAFGMWELESQYMASVGGDQR
jgi:hypothetical protein